MNYLRLSSRVDAVASRVESAVKMQMVTKQMAGVVKGMDASLQSMDVEKVRGALPASLTATLRARSRDPDARRARAPPRRSPR